MNVWGVATGEGDGGEGNVRVWDSIPEGGLITKRWKSNIQMHIICWLVMRNYCCMKMSDNEILLAIWQW